MKELIKKFDRKFLFNVIGKTHNGLLTIQHRMSLPKITPLRKGTLDIFSLKSRYAFFQQAQYFLQVNRVSGVYCEFGSHEVNTFRMALNTLGAHGKPNKIHKFFAFDSFQGMPQADGLDQQKIWRKGMNFTSEEKFHEIVQNDMYRCETVKGFYEDSLPKYKWSGDKIALAYVDCDYYSSTKTCLDFLEDKISHGTLLAFDDWNCYYADPARGQRKAFEEFKAKTADRLYFEPFFEIKSGGYSFVTLEKKHMGTDLN